MNGYLGPSRSNTWLTARQHSHCYQRKFLTSWHLFVGKDVRLHPLENGGGMVVLAANTRFDFGSLGTANGP